MISPRDNKDIKICETVESSSSSNVVKPLPILSVELTEEIPLEKFWIGKIKDKRNISKVIKSTTSLLPLKNFGHLKRCNDVRIILSPLIDNVECCKELKQSLIRNEFDLSLLEDKFEIINLPSKSCKTKKQLESVKNIWPLNFHPDPTIELIITGNIFDKKLLNRIELLMRLTIEACSIESIGNDQCNGSTLIVDPKTGESLALASSQLNENPLYHSSMIAIDLISKIQGGGSWNLINNNKQQQRKEKNNEIIKKRKFEYDLPLRYPASLNKINFPQPEPLELKSTSSKSSKEKMETESNINFIKKTGPYLCTNYWIFLIQEPCTMCSMALLHSRASKIFYGVKNDSSGVLGSKALLHTTPGLNHRYQVWCDVLENECKKSLKSN